MRGRSACRLLTQCNRVSSASLMNASGRQWLAPRYAQRFAVHAGDGASDPGRARRQAVRFGGGGGRRCLYSSNSAHTARHPFSFSLATSSGDRPANSRLGVRVQSVARVPSVNSRMAAFTTRVARSSGDDGCVSGRFHMIPKNYRPALRVSPMALARSGGCESTR
jgi:hypothetical protein